MIERIVVDTNVFVSALRSPEGSSREVLRRCLKGEALPLMGQKLFLEYADVLERAELFADCPISEKSRSVLLRGFLSACTWVEVFFLWRPNLPDEGDNHVLELAVAGGASAVITHNVIHFQGELRFPKLRVVTPVQYLNVER